MNRLKNIGLLLILSLLTLTGKAQQLIGGVVNQYSPVTDIDLCANTVTVGDSAFFSPGDRVLLIQMKGAQVVTNDNGNYGSVTNYEGAGNYEFHDIESISNGVIEFKNAMLKFFEPSGRVQLIKVAQYGHAVTQSPLTAPAWNGETGGVIAIEADTLVIFDSIDLFGKGFRGGQERNVPFCYAGGVGGYVGFRCDTADNCGAPKGEGIYEESRILGRGTFVNGGGGGNDHNTGGGGGGNFGQGGLGGERLNVTSTSCPGPGPGRGGRSLLYSNDSARTFLGGGGGAGDMNNNVGTAGGNGGGLIILNVGLLDGEATINAAGEPVLQTAGGDGAGGGGAGGTVMIQADSIRGIFDINLKGGRGGDVSSGTPSTFCFGPGGGGAGGSLWLSTTSLPSSFNVRLGGGRSGEQVFGNPPTNCPAGSTNGATAGDTGGVVYDLQLSYPSDSFIALQSSACCDTVICLGDSTRLTVSGVSTFEPTYVWLSGSNDSVEWVKPTTTRVFSVSAIDHQGCIQTHIINIGVNSPSITAIANPDSGVTVGSPVQLSVDTFLPGASYRWTPASILNDSTSATPIATPFQNTDFCVTVTDSNGCKARDCVRVTVQTPIISIPNAFSPNGDDLNDRFRIVMGEGLLVEKILIYNRWGELLYEAANNDGWDGKHEGADQPSGTYVYYVHITNPSDPDQVILETGSFSLVR